MKKGMGHVPGQPGTINRTNTGKAGKAVGLPNSKGSQGVIVSMGGKKHN